MHHPLLLYSVTICLFDQISLYSLVTLCGTYINWAVKTVFGREYHSNLHSTYIRAIARYQDRPKGNNALYQPSRSTDIAKALLQDCTHVMIVRCPLDDVISLN